MNASVTHLNVEEQPVSGLQPKITAILETEDISQAAIAREAEVDGAALAAWLRGDYAGDPRGIERRLSEWMEHRNPSDGVAMPGAPEWLETPTARKIYQTLQYSHAAGSLSIIYGASGIGKSETIDYYSKDNQNVWTATLSPARTSVASALEEVAYALRMANFPLRAARLEREIINRLKGTRGLLIVDEADHGKVEVMETLRLIREQSKIGMVLCGNERLYSLLTGGGSRSTDAARLFARVGKRLYLKSILKGDIKGLAKGYGVTGKAEMDMVLEIGETPGALHAVSETLRLAAVLAAGEGKALSAEYIRSAWKDLTGE